LGEVEETVYAVEDEDDEEEAKVGRRRYLSQKSPCLIYDRRPSAGSRKCYLSEVCAELLRKLVESFASPVSPSHHLLTTAEGDSVVLISPQVPF
jgi:hypothetical protein